MLSSVSGISSETPPGTSREKDQHSGIALLEISKLCTTLKFEHRLYVTPGGVKFAVSLSSPASSKANQWLFCRGRCSSETRLRPGERKTWPTWSGWSRTRPRVERVVFSGRRYRCCLKSRFANTRDRLAISSVCAAPGTRSGIRLPTPLHLAQLTQRFRERPSSVHDEDAAGQEARFVARGVADQSRDFGDVAQAAER